MLMCRNLLVGPDGLPPTIQSKFFMKMCLD
jgi:hypothetical protein